MRQNRAVSQPTAAPTATPTVLDDALLREIASSGIVKRYPARTVLINEGDQADTLFIILSGRVKAYAGNAAGKEIIFNDLGPGEYFGELPLDGGLRSASVATVEPTTCALVTGANLRAFLVDHPDFALQLIRGLIHRVRLLTDSTKSLALDDVYSRVATLLQRLAVDDGTQRSVPQRLTQQDIAEQVGASREMVSRIFKDLTAGGYLSVKAGRIVLHKALPAAW